VHEVKSSSGATEADEAQVIHYCYRLRAAGTDARGGVLHYPKTRRTRRITYTPGHDDRARADIASALAVILASQAPGKIARGRCRGCSFLDYCWAGD
jgi:CRISPR-associated exonuclease Cas4